VLVVEWIVVKDKKVWENGAHFMQYCVA